MKVSFVLPHSGRSGGVKSTVKAANGLLHRGHDVRLLVNKNTGNIHRWLRSIIWRAFDYILVILTTVSHWSTLLRARADQVLSLKKERIICKV